MFVDSHAHLEMEPFDQDREEAIQRAKDAGVSYILNVGSNLEGSSKAIQIASRHPFISAAVGIHPNESKGIEDHHFKELKKLSKASEVVAIGETGLDYYRNYSPKKVQVDLFKKHIQLAKEVGKPIIIHCRDAWEDLLPILNEEKVGELGGIIHCFSGDGELALKCVDLGFFISFGGPLTYPKAGMLREAAKAVPSERLLTETDCPYLAPQSRRGKRNEPAFVVETSEKLAKIKGIHPGDLGRIVLSNIQTLFGFGENNFSEKITYKIRNSLYVNVTDRCTNNCKFCNRTKNPMVAGYDLSLKKEPTAEETIAGMEDPGQYDEVVFCGFGEPTLRLEFIKTVAQWVKERGGRVRINTNGHGNLIYKRNILPDLKGLVDTISVSLNAENEERYNLLCKPEFGNGSYQAVKDFIRESVKVLPKVIVSVVRVPENMDVKECEDIAENELGAHFRVREFNVVG